MYVPSLVDSSVHKDVTRYKFDPVTLTFDLWPWKSIGFQTLLRTKYVPSLVKIHWRMLILECSQGCYAVKIWPSDLDLWPWKSIGFQILLRTKYVPSLVKIHWRMLILECSQGCYRRMDEQTVALLYPFATSWINLILYKFATPHPDDYILDVWFIYWQKCLPYTE